MPGKAMGVYPIYLHFENISNQANRGNKFSASELCANIRATELEIAFIFVFVEQVISLPSMSQDFFGNSVLLQCVQDKKYQN